MSKSEIGVAQELVVLYPIAGPGEHDAAAIEHVGAVAERQRLADGLLDQQDRLPGLFQFEQRGIDLADDLRAESSEGSSSMSSRGEFIKARPIASICC